MADGKKPAPPAFRISPDVINKLGSELITNEYQALLELIKNSYDAGATNCVVKIHTEAPVPKGSSNSDGVGFVQIMDNGHGMSRDDLQGKWLHISHSSKRNLTESGLEQSQKSTIKGRPKPREYPLGAKGLGRLSTQRLGSHIEIFSNDGTGAHTLALDWRQISAVNYIEEVGVELKETPKDNPLRINRFGTITLITDLEESAFSTDNAINQLRLKLSQLVSPFSEIHNFDLSVEFNGQKVELIRDNGAIHENAQRHFKIAYDGKEIRLTGSISHNYSGSRRKVNTKWMYEQYIKRDKGKRFHQYLLKNKAKLSVDLGFSWQEAGRQFNFTKTIGTEDLKPLRLPTKDESSFPGPFEGNFFGFDLEQLELDDFKKMFAAAALEQGLSIDTDVDEEEIERTETKHYFEVFKDFAGVRVYRNGFEVPIGADWLELGRASTESTSFYNLRPNNTIGIINVNRRDNPGLVEVSSREGFQQNRYYYAFKNVLLQATNFATKCQEYIRRNETKFLADCLGKRNKVPPNTTTKELVNRVQSDIAKAVVSAKEPGTSQPSLVRRLEKIRDEASQLMLDIEVQQERNNSLTHLAAQGLWVEAASHELHRELGALLKSARLTRDSKDADKHQKFVKSCIGRLESLRKLAARLEPGLRYVRESREEISLHDAVKSIVADYEPSFKNAGIELRIVVDPHRPPEAVYANPGRLHLIFANLLSNNLYWVGRALEENDVESGLVTITLSGMQVFVEDNGWGISSNVQNTLFEPFVTGRPAATKEGRGLGLFLVQQLMKEVDCDAYLPPDKNKFGNYYRIGLDFTGIIFRPTQD